MYRILFLADLLLAGSTRAQTVILKCVDEKGAVTLTNQLCPPGTRLKNVRAYSDAPDNPAARQRLRDIKQEQEVRNQRARQERTQTTFYGPVAPSERDRQKQLCASARRAASDARRQSLDHSTIMMLDKAAVDACFGL